MSLQTVLNDITHHLSTLVPEQRLSYKLPPSCVWVDNEYEWDFIEEVQMFIRGNIPNNVFITLRFPDQPNSSNHDVTVDFYRIKERPV